ncbi:Telomere length regulation protein [Musa troglodytarum]|uniref:Telomere length regulation protein n=1 Tax=Musa troglodytarum TaxID=320322 RepID=A0A9E7HB80_9LILI|nr:Telomere length regulation protein [Musa troglodytarum]
MDEGAKGGSGRSGLETLVLEKVGEVSSAIDGAKHVDEVICALYSLAVRIFPVDSSALCDTIDPAHRSKVHEILSPAPAESGEWRQAFYYGPAFPTLARILIYNVAKDWLTCFSSSTKKQVYDSFFVQGPPTEIVQVLVPALMHGYDDAIYSNIERLLVRCLLKSEGIRHIVGEFRIQCSSSKHDYALKPEMLAVMSRVAQLLTSIPDKARLQASSALSSQYIFVDKFVFWKVFPICCLRWVLQFSVFECPPNFESQARDQRTSSFLDVAHQLISIWSRREFVQSSSMEQQAYVTYAVALCIEKMSKEELETTKDILHSILQGVSCRLESPIDLVRKMASSVALVFSKVVDPKNPLYLDDDCSEIIDWEFGFKRKDVVTTDETRKDKLNATLSKDMDKDKLDATLSKITESASHAKRLKDTKHHPVDGGKLISECRVNHCAGMPNNEHASAEEDNDEGKNSDASSSDSLEPYDLSDDDTDMKLFSQLGDIAAALRKPDDPDGVERALDSAEKLVRATPDELPHYSGDLVRALVHVRCSDVAVEGEEDSAEGKRQKALVALLVTCPFESLDVLTRLLYSPNVDVSQRILILDVMTEAAQELSESTIIRMKHQQRNLISNISGQPWFIPSSRGPPGAGPWKEVSDPGTSISWSHRYEREIPSRAGQIKSGKSRKWGLVKAKDPELESSRNRFPLYAAAFMLPVMQGFDKKRHGVDLLNRDFVVLGKLIYMLGVCMKCSSMHPEASALAPPLLDMIRFRELSHHAEAYVRRSVLFAASCILVALHPSHVASALIEGNQEISNGLEWIRTWALHIAESDPDAECSTMAMTCLQLHAEMALQTSRALESAKSVKARTNTLPLKLDEIIIPFSNMR